MPKFLRIKNFERYQHFKKANPPWIKLYRSLFTDREFMLLPLTAKYTYIGLIMLASEGSQCCPNDTAWISHRLSIKPSEVDLKPLYRSGFLIASDSTIYRETRSKLSLREETETETEKSRVESAQRAASKKVLRSITDEDRPTEKHRALAQSLGVDLGAEWGKFKNYCLAHDKRYANFEAAFRNWIANSITMRKP